MNRYGPRKRTASDRQQQALLFVHQARPEKVRAHTAETLAKQFNVSVDYARSLLLAQGGMG